MIWNERKTVIYKVEQLPFEEEKMLLISPELIRLIIPGYKNPVDIGSWCYSKRRIKVENKNSESRINLVDESSFRSKRKDFLFRYLGYLRSHVKTGKSLYSLKTSFAQFKRFVDWCDDNYVEGLDSKDDFVVAVGLFTEYLIDLVRKSEVNVNTSAALQLVVMTAGRYMYSDQYGDLFRGVRRISRSLNAVNFTEVPSEENVKSALMIYSEIFNQLTDFVIGFQEFPKKIYIFDSYFWFFPSQLPFAGPSNVYEKTHGETKYKAYDYINGEVRSLESALNLFKYKSAAVLAIDRAKKRLDMANENKYDHHRLLAASMAYQAFIMLFSANTGMSLSQIRGLEWSDDYTIDNDRQGFKTIKYRAGGREVEFFIESGFINFFKKALRLRDYLLKSCNLDFFDFLFFKVFDQKVYNVGMDFCTDFNSRLERCFGYANKVNTRMWRAHKSDWLLRNSDVITTSMILQNTPRTVLKHYSEGSEVKYKEEMGGFFGGLRERLIISKNSNSTSTAVGRCIGGGEPVSESNALNKLDCRLAVSCFWCKNYRVHADSEDYIKLLSFRYVLTQSKSLSKNLDHFNKVVPPILDKIDSILMEVESLGRFSKENISELKKSVNDEEQLSDYWMYKIKIMDELEIGI